MLLLLIAIAGFSDQNAAAEFEPKLTGIKCVVSGKAVNKNYSCAFKKGKLFFDCNESRREFLADKSPFIIKANHQLVVTGQYLQTKCPVKQVIVDREKHSQHSIAGIELLFCCPGCRGQMVSKVNIHEQIRYVFDNRRFNAIFQPRIELAKRGSIELK